MVGRQQKLEVFLLGFGEQTLGQLDFVIFHERFADGQPLRFFKSVRHASANQHGVRDLHQVFYHFNFVADLGAAENRGKGTRGISDRFPQVGKFFLHEQAGGGLSYKPRDADHRSVHAMCRAKCIANE